MQNHLENDTDTGAIKGLQLNLSYHTKETLSFTTYAEHSKST